MNKNANFFILILVVMFSFSGSSQVVKNKAYSLTLSALLSSDVPSTDVYKIENAEDFLFLDARTKREFEVSHLQNAVWVGYDDFSLERLTDIPKDKPLVIYCSVGYRSEKITQKLMENGFVDVQNLYGGIFEWVNAGKPVFNGTEVTDTVHAYDQLWGVWLNKGHKVYK